MHTVADIKRFILKALKTWGLPVPEAELVRTCQGAFTPRPLLSDIHDAFRELEDAEFISGTKDDLDERLVTWTLTVKGQHKAKQLP